MGKLKRFFVRLVLVALLTALYFINTATPPTNNSKMISNLGGFNGLGADIMFIYAQMLKDEKRYDELPTLASLIVKLQPDYTDTISFWSHELSFNISLLYGDYSQRWEWIQRGINLLKDDALPNHECSKYYLEIGNIYRLRIGEVIEPADDYFKTLLALQIQSIIGDYDMELLAEDPELIETAGRLQKEMGIDAKKALAVEQEFGKVDWRLPETIALYWGVQGRNFAWENDEKSYKSEQLISRCLSRNLSYGTLLYINDKSQIQLAPNFTTAEATLKLFPEMLKKYKGSFKAVQNNYLRYLLQLNALGFAYGEHELSLKAYQLLQKKFPGNVAKKSRERMAIDTLAGVAGSADYRNLQSLLNGLYLRMFEFIAKKEIGKAQSLDYTAGKIWQHFQGNPDVMSYEKEKLPQPKVLKQQLLMQIKKGDNSFLKQRLSKVK